MTDQGADFSGVEMEVSRADLKKALGYTPDELLLAMTDGNLEWLADALVKRAQMTDRVLSSATDNNWNYVCEKLWQPSKLIAWINQWLRNNPNLFRTPQ